MKHLTVLLFAAASTLAAANPYWFYTGMSVGKINPSNPKEFWIEIEVTNSGKHAETVELRAHRYNGAALVDLEYTIERGQTHTFKVEDSAYTPTANRPVEPCSVFVRRLDGRKSSLTFVLHEFSLQGNQLISAELRTMDPVKPTDNYVQSIAYLMQQNPEQVTVTDVTGEARLAAVCRGDQLLGCTSEAIDIHLAAYGTARVALPPGNGPLLILHADSNLIMASWRSGLGSTTSTFDVHSGVTFGPPVQ